MRYFFFLLFSLIACKSGIKYPEGGFYYPSKIADSDTSFYFYPIKDIEDRREAFDDSYAYLFYRQLNEPNLSIKPQQNETFRLTYSHAFGFSRTITLTPNEIIVKRGVPISFIYENDKLKLSEIEKLHFWLLERRYPLKQSGNRVFLKMSVDSLVKLYPQLLDPNYYHKLYKKTLTRNNENFDLPTSRISLTKEQYNSLVQEVNASGFWSMPYYIKCEDLPRDADSFIFEANTHKKYNVVKVDGCPGNTSKFIQACQRLVNLAKMDKEIHLIWEGGIDTVKIN
jgi:hypothetical protein